MNFELLIVIPTRNRADLVIRAVESILSCDKTSPIKILISDNSTDKEECAILDQFMKESSKIHPQIISLIRPTIPMSMTDHWEFAITYGMSKYDSSHFTFLTDRMFFKKGMLKMLLDISYLHQHEIISYSNDYIDDYNFPIKFNPAIRSGGLYEIDSSSLLNQVATMSFRTCLPRMLNCVSPRRHLESLEEEYGRVFSSISPDFCFCFQTLAITDSILFLDESILTAYALSRSNGASFSRGLPSRDSEDFKSNLKHINMNPYSPIPEIQTVGNGIINEYINIKNKSSSAKFPSVNNYLYRRYLALEISKFLDQGLRDELLNLLRKEGFVDHHKSSRRSWLMTVEDYVSEFISVEFDSIEDAISFASSHTGPHVPWMHRLTGRYGKNLVRS